MGNMITVEDLYHIIDTDLPVWVNYMSHGEEYSDYFDNFRQELLQRFGSAEINYMTIDGEGTLTLEVR